MRIIGTLSRLITFAVSTNPWTYLGNFDIERDVENNIAFFGGAYQLLKAVGFLGCAITLVIACIKILTANPHDRAEAKSLIGKKLVIMFCLFGLAWIFGFIVGLLKLL